MKILTICLLCLVLVSCVSCVSGMNVDFYYSESCPHCKQVYPMVLELSKYSTINFLDVSKGNYDIQGVPLVQILTSDYRIINLVGSQEIPKYLECELNEQSNLNCITFSADNSIGGSWFVRE